MHQSGCSNAMGYSLKQRCLDSRRLSAAATAQPPLLLPSCTGPVSQLGRTLRWLWPCRRATTCGVWRITAAQHLTYRNVPHETAIDLRVGICCLLHAWLATMLCLELRHPAKHNLTQAGQLNHRLLPCQAVAKLRGCNLPWRGHPAAAAGTRLGLALTTPPPPLGGCHVFPNLGTAGAQGDGVQGNGRERRHRGFANREPTCVGKGPPASISTTGTVGPQHSNFFCTYRILPHAKPDADRAEEDAPGQGNDIVSSTGQKSCSVQRKKCRRTCTSCQRGSAPCGSARPGSTAAETLPQSMRAASPRGRRPAAPA